MKRVLRAAGGVRSISRAFVSGTRSFAAWAAVDTHTAAQTSTHTQGTGGTERLAHSPDPLTRMPPKRAARASKPKLDAAADASASTPFTLPLTYEKRVWESESHAADTHTHTGGHGVLCVGVDEAGRGPLAGPVVAAAVAILDASNGAPPVLGVDDSKKIDEPTREALFESLMGACEGTGTHASGKPSLTCGIAVIDHGVIDRINILNATMLAMELAVAELQLRVSGAAPEGRGAASMPMHRRMCVLVDGPKVPARLQAACEADNTVALPALAEVGSYATTHHPPGPCDTSAPAPAPRSLHPLVSAGPLVGGDAKCYSIAAASLIAKVTRDRIMRELAKRWPEYGLDIHKGYGTAAHMSAIHKHGPCPIHRRTFAPVKNWFPLDAPKTEDDAAGGPKSAAGGKKPPAARGRAKTQSTTASDPSPGQSESKVESTAADAGSAAGEKRRRRASTSVPAEDNTPAPPAAGARKSARGRAAKVVEPAAAASSGNRRSSRTSTPRH